MDQVVEKIIALGLPGVILLITMAATGVEATFAVPLALTILGGPFGMLGGLTVLGIIALIGDALSRFGVEAILSKVYLERRKTEPITGLFREIDSLPISDDLKRKLKDEVENKVEA
jgi:hypothetical protein